MINFSDIISKVEQNKEDYNKLLLTYPFRLVNGTGQDQKALAESFQKYCQGIAEKLMGADHDFEDDPVCFTISDVKELNAAYILSEIRSPKHVIAITKGMLDILETEDDLAFVLGHELAHLHVKKEIKTDSSSKLEEGFADVFAIESMMSAGYDPKAASSIRKKITPDTSGDNIAMLFAILDEHLLKDNNLFMIDAILTKLNQKHNIDAMQPTPINKKMIKSFLLLSHTSFVDETEGKTIQERYDYFYDNQELLFLIDEVKEDVVSYLNAQNLETEEDKQRYIAFLERFLQPYSDSEDIFNADEGIKFYVLQGLNEEYLKQIDIQKIPALRSIAETMTRFMEAKECQEAAEAGLALMENIESIYMHLDNNSWRSALKHSVPAFEAPVPTAASVETAVGIVPWQKYIDWKEQYNDMSYFVPSYNVHLPLKDVIVKALSIFGIRDYRLPISEEIDLKDGNSIILKYDLFNITKPFYTNPEGERVDIEFFDSRDKPDEYGITHDGRVFSVQEEDVERNKRYCHSYGNDELNRYSDAFKEYMYKRDQRVKDFINRTIDFGTLSPSELKTELDKLSFIKSYTIGTQYNSYIRPSYLYPVLNGIRFDQHNYDYLDQRHRIYIDKDMSEKYNSWYWYNLRENENDDNIFFKRIISMLSIINKFPNDEKRQFVDTLMEIYFYRTTCEQRLILAYLLGGSGIQEILPPEVQFGILHQIMIGIIEIKNLDRQEAAAIISNFVGLSTASDFDTLQSNIERTEQFYADITSALQDVHDIPCIHNNIPYINYIDDKAYIKNIADINFEDYKDMGLGGFMFNKKGDLPYAKAVLMLDYMTRTEDHIFDLSKLEDLGGSYLADNEFLVRSSRQILAPFVENEANWPADLNQQIAVYSFLKNNNLFPSDRKFQVKKTEDILNSIGDVSDEQKVEYLKKLLVKKGRIPDPDLRSHAIDMYTDAIAKILGEDDNRPEYLQRVKDYIEQLRHVDLDEAKANIIEKSNIIKEQGLYADDNLEIALKLSDKILSQKEVSQYLEPDSSLTKVDMEFSLVLGPAVEAITTILDRDPNAATRTIDFFINPNTPENAAAYFDFLQKSVDLVEGERFKQKYAPEDMVLLHDNYWAASTETRAGVMARILQSTMKKEGTKDNQSRKPQWKQIFNFVMDRMLDSNSPDTDAVKIILRSYIASKAEYEREFILAGMLTAAQKIEGAPEVSRGVALRKFLEGMGPAEIKLGQAIGSYPGTPDDIKKEMQDLKSSAAPPARWEIFEWMKKEMPKEYREGIQKLGERLGSASYFVTCRIHKNNGQTAVVGFLRPEAQNLRSKSGFNVLVETAKKIAEHEQYKDTADVMKQLIEQASCSSKNELNMDTGSKQADLAHEKIYGGKTVIVDGYEFTFHSASWNCYGENFKEMEEVKGVHFNDLEDKSDYKIAVAKAYLTLELGNLLSGNIMDHDRHGAQLKIDKETDTIGIFDNGALSIEPPAKEEKIAFGKILRTVFDAAINKQDLMYAFTDEIMRLSEQKDLPDYLLETQKALLALQDFMQAVPSEQLNDVIVSALRDYKVDKDIVNGFVQTTKIEGLFAQAARGVFTRMPSQLKDTLIKSTVKIIHGTPEKREKAYFIEKSEQSKEESVTSIGVQKDDERKTTMSQIQAVCTLFKGILSEPKRNGSVNGISYDTLKC